MTTNTQAGHTPGEIRVLEDKVTAWPRLCGPQKPNGKYDIIALFPVMQDPGVKAANAARLAQCWNDHDTLVALVGKMLETMAAALCKLENMTSEEFTSGGDREIRELLAGTIAAAESAGVA